MVGVTYSDFVKTFYIVLYDSLISMLGKHNVEEINEEDARLFWKLYLEHYQYQLSKWKKELIGILQRPV